MVSKGRKNLKSYGKKAIHALTWACVSCSLSGPLRVLPWTLTHACLITIMVVDRKNESMHRDFEFESNFED